MQLSKDFTLSEFVLSSKVLALDIDNIPNEEHKTNILRLVNYVLQPARDALGFVINITSGYRSPELNKAIGGSKTSDHQYGKAADLQCEDNAKLFNHIKDNLDFDQLIWEFGNNNQPKWVHVSYRTSNENRKQVLRSKVIKGKVIYEVF